MASQTEAPPAPEGPRIIRRLKLKAVFWGMGASTAAFGLVLLLGPRDLRPISAVLFALACGVSAWAFRVPK